MPPDRGELREDLLAVMDRKNHWAWSHFENGHASRDQLLLHYQQEWEVHVRDFPILLSRIHSRTPAASVRRELAENLFEEDTGKLSGSGPHPDLFLHMMKGLGFPRSLFREVRLLPEASAYRKWIDQITSEGTWLEGVALVTLFIEGSANERRYLEGEVVSSGDPADSWLARNYGVEPRYLELKRAHGQVEGDHRSAAWRMVLDNTGGPRAAERVVRVMRRALDLWLRYRDAVAKAGGIRRRATGRG